MGLEKQQVMSIELDALFLDLVPVLHVCDQSLALPLDFALDLLDAAPQSDEFDGECTCVNFALERFRLP